MWRKVTSYLPERLRPEAHSPVNVVATVRLHGVIDAGHRPRPGRINLQSTEETLRRAFELPGLRAVALVINSPGGSPVQSSLMYTRVRQLRERAQRERGRDFPLLAFVEDVAASGGYYVAAAADEIYADPSSLVGSIGAVSSSFGVRGLADRLGLERRQFTAGAHKVRLDPFASSVTPDDAAWVQRMLDGVHANFKAAVRASRGARLRGDDAALFDGDVHLAPAALELGLIDGLGEVEAVCRRKYGDDTRFSLVLPPRKSLFDAVAAGPFGAAAGDGGGGGLLQGLLHGAARSSGSDAGHADIGYEAVDGALARLADEDAWTRVGARWSA
jgi:signal peptide peptidase SppA